MKKLILMLTVIATVNCFSQAITVNTSTYSVPQLVNSVLINSPCVSATNITWKTGTNFGSTNGIGFFQNSNSNFPMQSGVILSTGNVANAAGPNTTSLNDGAANWPGDSALENTLLLSGIPMSSVNATVLEFDFTPISSAFSFDFLFASEEYGNFQCQFSDAFAFLLTNTTTGVTTNLAVVPNTTSPISVVTIRDFLYNSSCASVNSQYFGSYNGGSAAASAPINYNGQTKLLNASAILIPNTLYHIKLVIADRSDSSSDSAIFISSDTFNIGQDVLGQDISTTSITPICFGDTHILTSGLNPANYTFSWTQDGNTLVGETGPNLSITQSGIYGITYQKTINGCQPITDLITVNYLPEMITPNPTNIYKCITGGSTYTYDLSINTPIVKAGLDPLTQVTYYATLANANSGTGILPTTYTSAPGQTIYVKIKSANNPCYIVKSFQLLTAPAPIANQPPNLTKCSTSIFNNASVNLPDQNAAVLNGQSPSINIVSYYLTAANANAGTSPAGPTGFAPNNTTIYVRVQNVSDSSCFSVTSFTIYITTLPVVDVIANLVLCNTYTLLPLTNGNYFTGPNGTGTPLFAGDIITETQTIYIFNQPNGPTGCSASSSFQVTIIDPLTLAPSSGTYCGSYTLPQLENGEYYTTPGNTGTHLVAGTVITESQTLYVYFESIISPFCILNTDFTVTILPTLNIGTHTNVFDCTSYTLPSLPSGNYFTEAGGAGTQIAPGTVLFSSQTVYVYGVSSNSCVSQASFEVVIGIDSPADVSQCQPYTLPELVVGNYYTGPQGTGQQIPAGTIINLTQIVYVYVSNGNNPNCTDNIHFNIIISQPIIDILNNVTSCGSYTLPSLISGEYFTGINGTGTALFAGDIITTNQLVYIFKRSASDCFNQSSFNVTINPKPLIDSRADIDICNSYVLTELTIGNYFTGPNGTGTMLPSGTVITTSQLIYIYAVSNVFTDCTAENSFNITVFSVQADAPSNVVACDSYILPALTSGDYYTQSGGTNIGESTLMHAGDVILNSMTLYVYKESGERINCTDENSFTITINHTPIVAPVSNKNACNSYTLPQLLIGNYYTGANGTGTLLHENDVLTTNQTIYIYAETGTTPNCYDEKSFNVSIFNVDQLPNVTICENYTLPVLNIGNYYSGPIGTGTHLFAGQTINSSQTIYIYATSSIGLACYDESSFTVTIVDTPIAHSVPNSLTTTCDQDGNNDGITDYDLSLLNTTILGNQTSSEFDVTYYANQSDAIAEINPIVSTNLQTVFVKVKNTLTTNCFDLKTITLKVNKLPEPTPLDGIICFDSETNTLLNPYTISSGLSSNIYTFQWLNEAGNLVGTGSNYVAILPGTYSVIARSSITGCSSEQIEVIVSPSEPAVLSYAITDNFSDNQTITVEATGVGGDYEYQLDFGSFQDSPIFDNVSSGDHIITVRDKNGCGNTTSKALVVNYPKFFTPNGDGFNDTWNIVDLKAQTNAIIYIYDRYGKLLREIRPNGQGWDGSFSGRDLPSSDYWFTIKYEEVGIQKEFKSHFTLKR